ncbi:winged helix-turn-helix transcriptional regulator [Candidatus Woesearchaeota archaeon]|nr:winged helix-turn-helix transcriptional regulator [Candidatus Woesearchaeota archaeon]
MGKTRELDEAERKIVKELIRNARISDNQIAKNTKIPVMTVNRKRKLLEKEKYLKYFTSLDTGEHGTGKYKAKQLYIIKFKIGITRDQFIELVEKDKETLVFGAYYISLSYLGEKDGHLAYMCVLDAETESKLMDEFNSRIIPHMKEKLGEDCIQEMTTMRVTNTLRRHHNYVPFLNMEGGVMKKDWPDEYIFVDKANIAEEDEKEGSSV